MRSHNFFAQKRTGQIGEAYFRKMHPTAEWISSEDHAPWDFVMPNGDKIEVKTKTTYPQIWVKTEIQAKDGTWSPYGEHLSKKLGVDYLYYFFLDKNTKGLNRCVRIKPSAFVRAFKKVNKKRAKRGDSNKIEYILNFEDLLQKMKKGVSWHEIDFSAHEEEKAYTVLLTPEEASNRPLWLKKRGLGLGCSDVYTLFGESRFKTIGQLFDEKVFGLKEEITDPATLQRFWWGHAMEPLLTDWWNEFKKEELGEAEEWQALLKSTKVYGLLGTPDARCGDSLIEYKTTNPRTYTKSWQSGKRVPEHYYYQVQAQILLTGMDTCYVMVARALQIAPRILKVEKDQKLVDKIAFKVEEFWKKVEEEKKKHGI